MNYKNLNIILGWFAFLVSLIVYTLTAEETAGFWDCGEYIATSYKLQVGHPPGAPMYQLLGRFFSLFAFGDLSRVAFMVNMLSAVSSAFTILFLFWSITYLTKKVVVKGKGTEMTDAHIYTILGSGLVGSLAYTFTESFWFSAVEGEVYALSSFFTAVVFWVMLRWDAEADQKHSLRWLLLIAYLVGLSIGVHLLNLLAVPALALIYYFRKYETTWKGTVIALLAGVGILGFIQMVLIPIIPSLAGLFERIFVNGFKLPFNSGIIVYFALILGGIVWGVRYTHKRGMAVLNTLILSISVLLIGYSSFFVLVVRSNASPPIDENNPENAMSLHAYLAREQYGTWPLLTGHYYNAPVVNMKDGSPVYNQKYLIFQDGMPVTSFFSKKEAKQYVEENGGRIRERYVITDDRTATVPVHDDRFNTVFPRMWSSQRSHHGNAYQEWSHKNKGERVIIGGTAENPQFTYIPTMGENINFFIRYQLNHMYFRYFMWNFAGRQNDLQGHGGPLQGNWLSGIKVFDQMRLGPQDNLPDHLANNKGRNKYFLLPLILGIIGLVFHTSGNYKDSLVVMMLFVMTGIAIVVYLNQYPYQPRERDYSYAASFYAFAIWIGIGIAGIVQWIDKHMKNKLVPVLVTLVMLLLVPGIMAKENWDDHDRSRKTLARDVAKHYLNACGPKGIVFTNGDNDTFPLWYAQEVEEIRTDVKVVNLSLFNTDWYIDMSIRKTYNAPGIPITFTKHQYIQGSRDYVLILPVEEPGNMMSEPAIIQYFLDDMMERDSEVYSGPADEIRGELTRIVEASTIAQRFPSEYQKMTDPATPFSELLRYINFLGSEQSRASNDQIGLNTDRMRELQRGAKQISDRIVYGYIDLDLLIEFIKSDDPATKRPVGTGRMIEWFPTNKVRLPVNKENVLSSGVVPDEDAHLIEEYIYWDIEARGIQKNHVMMLDMLVANEWVRPVHFAITTGDDMYLNLMQWFRHDGMVYTLVPMRNTATQPPSLFVMLAHGTTNTNILWDVVMSPDKADYTSLRREGVYFDETARRPLVSFRSNFSRLALALIEEGKRDSAITVLNKSIELLPNHVLHWDAAMIAVVNAYYLAGDTASAVSVAEALIDNTEKEFNYYITFDSKRRGAIRNEMRMTGHIMLYLNDVLQRHNMGQGALPDRASALFNQINAYMQ
jgi:hypothetical protein